MEKTFAHVKTRSLTLCSFFIALTIIGAYISIPIPVGPVPIVFADFFIMLAARVLGVKRGMGVAAAYLVLGLLGFPVFSGGGGGVIFFLGPTGGFLMGYLLLAAASGLFNPRGKHSALKSIFPLILGNLLLYASGTIWLVWIFNMPPMTAAGAAVLPFLPGTLLKIMLALAISQRITPFLRDDLHK